MITATVQVPLTIMSTSGGNVLIEGMVSAFLSNMEKSMVTRQPSIAFP